MTDPQRIKALIRTRMRKGGNYVIVPFPTQERFFREIFPKLRPGDTVSLHPEEDGPPTLYEVTHDQQLEALTP